MSSRWRTGISSK